MVIILDTLYAMKPTTLVLLILILCSCSTIRTSFEYDNQVDFTEYKTFGFSEDSEKLPVNELVRKRIFAAISKNLVTKGYLASDNPDVLIDLQIHTEDKQQTSATTMNVGGSYGRRWGFRSGVSTTQFHTRTYTIGTLFIDIVDMGTETLVWSGQGTSTVTKKTIPQEKMEAGINKILANYPPLAE